MINKLKIFVLYIFFAIIVSVPLANNLNKICLPTENIKSLGDSDFPIYIEHSELARNNLIKKHEFFVLENSGLDIAVTYDYFYIFFRSFNLNETAIYNLFFLLVLSTSGYATYLFVHWLSKNTYVSFFAGLLYISSNYVFNEYYWGHVNLIQIQYIPLIFLFIEKNFVEKKISNVIFLALFIYLQIISSSQYSLYLSVIMILYITLRLGLSSLYKTKIKYKLNRIITASILALVISFPYINFRLHFNYDLRSVENNLSSGFIITNLNNLLDINKNIYIGVISFIMFIIGLFNLYINKTKSNIVIYFPYIVLIIICIMLMFGPYSNVSLYSFLYHYYPFFNYFRVPLRFFPFLNLFIIICASSSLLLLKDRMPIKIFKMIYILIIFLTVTLSIISTYSRYYFHCTLPTFPFDYNSY